MERARLAARILEAQIEIKRGDARLQLDQPLALDSFRLPV